MRYVNQLMNGVFDAVLAPLRMESAWPGLCAVALLTSVLVLLIFRFASDPRKVRRRRDRLLARVLELVLFKDDLAVNLAAFGRVLAANASYLGALLIPFAVSCLPATLILAQSFAWFDRRPILPGETAVLTAQFATGFDVLSQDVKLAVPEGLEIATGPVRAPARREICWVLRATGETSSPAEISAAGQTQRKTLLAGHVLGAVSTQRAAAAGWNTFLNPRERPFPAGSVLERVALAYPEREFLLGGLTINWVLAFFVLTMAFGLLLKRPFGAEF